jgi:hypothetical protein
MSTRREAIRIAGWAGIAAGLSAMALGAVTGLVWAQVLGAYGLLFVLAGAWAVGGLAILSRVQRRTLVAQASSRIVRDPREPVSR